MPKTNFTKVEDSLKDSLNKIQVEEWGKLADIAQSVERPEMRKMVEKASIAAKKRDVDRKAIIHSIQQSMKHFKDPAFYKEIGIEQEALATFIKTPKELKANDWVQLQAIRLKIQAYKENFTKEHDAECGNEALVEKARTKHINKRYNVNDKWLPLK